MTNAAQEFLRSFQALPPSDQRAVLDRLLRLQLKSKYTAPSDDDLVGHANEVFLELEKAESAT